MRFSRFTAGALIVMLHLVVPLSLILWTWIGSSTSLTAWLLQMLVLSFYVAFIFHMGSWVYASFYLRYTIIILAITAALWSFMHARSLPVFVSPHIAGWVAYGVGLAASALLAYFTVGAVRARFYDERPVNLAFPFKRGTYAVFEGGNGKASSLMNYHYGASIHKGAHTNLSMKYAVDITKVTCWGNDADGFLPMENEKYAVFNEVVYSPCDGEVSAVEDEWPNETPWSGRAPYNVGNHVLLTSKDFGVLMGHLQKGSMLVRPGDRVTKGQPIAQAGNSGWTSQPHLHVQAMKKSAGSFWGWEGLPIFFDGKNPVKNSLFLEH
jgi:Peptidase family M23